MTASAFTRRYEIFRELLIDHRKSLEVTQQDLAARVGKPQSYISKYESGERRLDLIEFIDIADALSIQKGHFIDELERRSKQ